MVEVCRAIVCLCVLLVCANVRLQMSKQFVCNPMEMRVDVFVWINTIIPRWAKSTENIRIAKLCERGKTRWGIWIPVKSCLLLICWMPVYRNFTNIKTMRAYSRAMKKNANKDELQPLAVCERVASVWVWRSAWKFFSYWKTRGAIIAHPHGNVYTVQWWKISNLLIRYTNISPN